MSPSHDHTQPAPTLPARVGGSLPATLHEVRSGSHRYDLAVIGAARELTLAHSQAGWGEGLPSRRSLARISALRRVLEPRATDVHAVVVRDADGRRVCSCGLVFSVHIRIDDLDVHLDQRTWNVAGAWVVLDDEVRGQERWVARCHCGWRQPAADEPACRAAVSDHRSTRHSAG